MSNQHLHHFHHQRRHHPLQNQQVSSPIQDGEDPLLRIPFHDPLPSSPGLSNNTNKSPTKNDPHGTGLSLSLLLSRKASSSPKNSNRSMSTVPMAPSLFSTKTTMNTDITKKDMAAAENHPAQAASASATSSAGGTRAEKPSVHKRHQLVKPALKSQPQKQQQQQKKQPQELTNINVPLAPLLHQTCRLFPHCLEVMQSSLDMEPQALTQRAPPVRPNSRTQFQVGDGVEPYSLPINILLQHNASLDVLKATAQACSEALLLPDGRDDGCALIIALRLRGARHKTTGNTNDHDDDDDDAMTSPAPTVVETLLTANPQAAQKHDRRRNFALHVATYVGASFAVISSLYYAFPEAVLEMNFYGETPLDIAIRHGKCSDATTNFLQDKVDHLKTARIRNHARTQHQPRQFK